MVVVVVGGVGTLVCVHPLLECDQQACWQEGQVGLRSRDDKKIQKEYE